MSQCYQQAFRLDKIEKQLPLYQKIEDAKGASQVVDDRLDNLDKAVKLKADISKFKEKTVNMFLLHVHIGKLGNYYKNHLWHFFFFFSKYLPL